ncbi:MAG: transposase [Planctomycetaceae bacterium]
MLGGKCGHCEGCPLAKRCPIQRDPMLCQLRINGMDLRLAHRRAHEKIDAFRNTYRIRSGIEATNSLLKRVTGLGRLRVRGRPAMFMSIQLKVAGWHILRAASVRTLLEKLTKHGHPAQFGKLSHTFETVKYAPRRAHRPLQLVT